MLVSRVAKVVIITGVVSSVLLSLIMGKMALDHNPQEEFTNNPIRLFVLVATWFIAAMIPFLAVSGILEIIHRIRTER